MIADNLPQFETKRTITSESQFPNNADIIEIIRYLRDRKAIGSLQINVSQGGVNTIVFVERKSVKDATDISIR